MLKSACSSILPGTVDTMQRPMEEKQAGRGLSSTTTLCRLSLSAMQALRHLVSPHAAVQLPSPFLDVQHIELATADCNELREILVVPGAI